MPYSLTPRQEETIKGLLVLALPHSKIASAANCTTCQIRRIKANLLKHGSVHAPKVVRQGHKCKITEEMEELCILTFTFAESLIVRLWWSIWAFDWINISMK